MPNFMVLMLPMLLLSHSSFATTFMERPFPEAVHEAPIIVHGKVGSSHTGWTGASDGTRRIFTFFELQVIELIKGKLALSASKNLIMREIGGEKDGIGMHVPGVAQFETGEDVIVFLGEENPDASYDVRGMMMGKLGIEKDAEGNEFLVGPAISGDPENEHMHENPQLRQENAAHGKKWTLGDLRVLAREKAQPSGTPESQPSSFSNKNLTQPSLRPSPTSESSAPQLQPGNEGAPYSSSSPFDKYLWFGVGGGVVVLGILIKGLRKK